MRPTFIVTIARQSVVHSYNAKYLETTRDLRSCDITNPFLLVMSQTLRGLPPSAYYNHVILYYKAAVVAT